MSDTADKAALRLALRARRRALHAESPQAAAMAVAAFQAADVPEFEVAAVYLPHGSEVDSLPLAAALRARGAELCLPTVATRDERLRFRRWTPGDPVGLDLLGLPAPLASQPELTPDLVVAPLLAFDREGRRLGQGGGYYDRTIEGLRAAGPVFVLGLAFSGQEVEALQDEPHDQRLDAILTERAYIPVRKD